MKRSLNALVMLTILAAVSCQKSGSSGSTINGTVKYKDKTVTGGTMLFHGKEKVFPASLGSDGNYTAVGLEPGDYVVTIDTTALKSFGDPSMMMNEMASQFGGDASKEAPEAMKKEMAKVKEMRKDLPKFVSVPEKYKDAKTSPLKTTVQSGSNTQDFTLTD